MVRSYMIRIEWILEYSELGMSSLRTIGLVTGVLPQHFGYLS